MKWIASACIAVSLLLSVSTNGAAYRNPYGGLPKDPTPGDRMFAEYFRLETQRISEGSLADIHSRADWESRREGYRHQLQEMLGLDPLPSRTDLKATITGVLDQPEFTVEKLHFQSMPGLYVTANLYLPKQSLKPVPAILYVCGHTPVRVEGVSYGNKVAYQGYGIWFARNGYACLVLDSVQLGEIEGIHHGTYREGMWWWNSRGYSSAAVEAWNCMRALDYLETRPEIDATRFGVTGRSGGGAYSWWVSALDDRIQVACPTAGITDLQNHVVDGTVEGHCDCMFIVNTYRWDYPQIAALVAPRPLLICNTDKDTIYPLDGVSRLHERVRGIYDLMEASTNLGLLITEGPHRDSQDLQVPVFRWFNRYLKHSEAQVQPEVSSLFTPKQLKVFDQLPSDQISARCYENFTRLASPTDPLNPHLALARLKERTFGAWPSGLSAPILRELASAVHEGVRLSVYAYTSQPGVELRLYLARPAEGPVSSLHFDLVEESSWRKRMGVAQHGFRGALESEIALAGVAGETEGASELLEWTRAIREQQQVFVTLTPRGVGQSRPTAEKTYLTHLRRRFMLLGQTLAGMQVFDVVRALEAVRQLPGLSRLPTQGHASLEMTEVAAFASLFQPEIQSLSLAQEPRSDKEAPDFLNWSRWLTPEQLLSLVKTRCTVKIGG